MLLALGLHWCVLGPGISGTFLIYLHSASKTHWLLLHPVHQTANNPGLQLSFLWDIFTRPREENSRLQSQWETSWEQLFAGDKACKLLWKAWEQKIKSDSTGPAHLSTWHVFFSWFIFTRPHHNFLILLSWSHPGFGRNIFIYLYFFLRWGNCSRKMREAWGNFRRRQSSSSGCVSNSVTGCLVWRGE